MRPKLLLIDNIDSFTWNLAQGFMILGAETLVVRNDEFTLSEAIEFNPTHLVISPGPGGPENTGISSETIAAFRGKIPILGVCLGHQLLAHIDGGLVCQAEVPMHGKPEWITHSGDGLFKGLPHPLKVGRYHSLIVSKAPKGYRVNAQTRNGLIMAMDRIEEDIYGLQFHPESILCPDGMQLLQAFLNCERPAKVSTGML